MTIYFEYFCFKITRVLPPTPTPHCTSIGVFLSFLFDKDYAHFLIGKAQTYVPTLNE